MSERRLVKATWLGAPTPYDIIQSKLVDRPNAYYMPTHKQHIYLLSRQRGLVLVTHDFTDMSPDEMNDYVVAVRMLIDE